jgi:hypothetical protein
MKTAAGTAMAAARRGLADAHSGTVGGDVEQGHEVAGGVLEEVGGHIAEQERGGDEDRGRRPESNRREQRRRHRTADRADQPHERQQDSSDQQQAEGDAEVGAAMRHARHLEHASHELAQVADQVLARDDMREPARK